MRARFAAAVVALLSIPSAAAAALRVDAALPNAEAVRARLPSATAAVEERLGVMDWDGVEIRAESRGGGPSSVPDWAAAFALPRRGIIVLRPNRIGGYPQGSLQTVLTHELAHIAIGRKEGPGELPRWFEEGLAMSVAGELGPIDMYHVSLALLFGPSTRLADLDARFLEDRSAVEAAYALSLSFVSWLGRESGPDAGRHILEQVGAGTPFEEAVRRVTGSRLDQLEAIWSREVVILYRWLPILSSTATLWMVASLLVILAWARKRRRSREIRERWEREDLDLDAIDNSGPHGPN